MFGLDVSTLEVLIPSLIGVIAIAGAMVWAWVKLKHLVDEDGSK